MHGVAFSQLTSEDGGGFYLAVVEFVDSEDEEGTGREVVAVIEGTEIVILVVLSDTFGVF